MSSKQDLIYRVLKLPYKTMCQPQSSPWTSGKKTNLVTIAEIVCWLKPSWDVQENVQNCNVFYCKNQKPAGNQQTVVQRPLGMYVMGPSPKKINQSVFVDTTPGK